MPIIPDIIVSWPRNCDYPLWRQYIRDHRAQFNEIIIVFTETNQGEDYRQFVTDAMLPDHVLTVWEYQRDGRMDWRDQAIKAGLVHSYNAPWILFTEQDFLPNDHDTFWRHIEVEMIETGAKVICAKDQERLHPCFMLFDRRALNQLSLDFGIVPDKLDHFGLIQKQLDVMNESQVWYTTLPNDLYSHMNGLSHNMTLVSQGGYPNYKPTEFTQYLQSCTQVSVPLDYRFLQVVREYFGRVGSAML